MATSTKIGPFGGPGGNTNFDHGVNTNIKQINIFSANVIHAIQIIYNKNGQFAWTERHGGKDGNRHMIKFDYPKEYIVSVSGYHSGKSDPDYVEVIQSLKIVTNKNTYGPFGTEDGETFSIHEPGKKIVGFFGKYTWYLNSIGAYTVPLDPERRYQTVGPFGGLGGSLWDDGVFTTIRQMEINHGDIIDSIRVEYDDNGKSVWKEKHGQGSGGKKSQVKLDYPNEYIVSVTGYQRTYGRNFVISSLKIQTNKRIWGPYGKEEGNPFTFPTSPTKIYGFHGRANSSLDAIGAHVEADSNIPPQVEPIEHIKLGPLGGYGGSSWDDGANNAITQIEINAGEIIDSFRVEYAKKGSTVWSDKRGQSNGGHKSLVKLDYPGEYITSVVGYQRTYGGNFVISSLKIQTNKRLLGPYGKEEGNSFKFPNSVGKIVGFHGRAGATLDSIGVYAVK